MPFSTTYSKIKTFVNGGKIYPSDLNDALDDLGVQLASVNVAGGFNEGSNVRRGKCIIPGAETSTNTAYGLMPTPDQVPNVVLPTNGLIFLIYQALWQESVNDTAKAAVFLNSNQLKHQLGNVPDNIPSEAWIKVGSGNRLMPLSSSWRGLDSTNGAVTVAGSTNSDVTTGQAVGGGQIGGVSPTGVFNGSGGICAIFAAAGTYTISVQFKVSSGTVTVQSRKMWVLSLAF